MNYFGQTHPFQQREYDQWLVVKPYFEKRRAEAEKACQEDLVLGEGDKALFATLKKTFGVIRLDTAMMHYPPTTDSSLIRKAQAIIRTWSN